MVVSIPAAAAGFMGAICACLILLVMLHLFLNKKLCFEEVGGFPCFEQKKKEPKAAKLVAGNMAQSAPGSQHEHTAEEEGRGPVRALVSYLRRVRTDMFGQEDLKVAPHQAQHCGFCGQQGQCDCQTKRGDDSAIEEDRSDITEALGDETVSAICQVNDTMRQILQEIKDIKEHSQSRHGGGSDVVTHEKYQHVVDDFLVARSCHQELEHKLSWYENALKGKEEEEKKNQEFQRTGKVSEPGGGDTAERGQKLEQENSLESESGHHGPVGMKLTDITQLKDMMSQLLQEISDLRKDKTEGKDTLSDETVENMNATGFDEEMEALDPNVKVRVKNHEGGGRTSTPIVETTPDENDKKFLEMQTSPIRKNPLESSSKVFAPPPRDGDRKVRLTADSQVQTVPIPRTREEVLRDLIQSDPQEEGPLTAGQNREGTRPVQNKTDSRMNSQELQTKCEKHDDLQHLDNNSVPVTVGVTTTCEKVEGKNITSRGGSLGFFNFGKDPEKMEGEKVESKVFSTSFFGFGQKTEDKGSASPINQRSAGFGLESKLSQFTSWFGDSIASTAMQLTRRSSEKTTDSLDQQQQQQDVSVPEQLHTSPISEPVPQSGDRPLSSDAATLTQQEFPRSSPAPVNEPPFTATYVTVQNVSPRGTLFHNLLQKTEETAKHESSKCNLQSETSQAKCQTEVQMREKSGQPPRYQIPQTSVNEVVPLERTLQTVDPVCYTPPVQRKVMRRSASLPRHAHIASTEPRSVHRHVHNVGVVTSTSQQQRLPRKGILHQKQHVCEDTSSHPELWKRRGSNCIQVEPPEISSDAAASDDSKFSSSTKPQKHVTYSPYVQRKIISPRHSPKDRPKFFVPFLVEYDESSSSSDEDLNTTYYKSSTSGQDKGDEINHCASQKLKSGELKAGQKLSSSPSGNPQTSSGSVKKRSSNLADGLSSDHKPRLTHKSEQASSNFLQVPGTIPSVRPKVGLRSGAEDCSRHSREKTSVQQSSRQPGSKLRGRKQANSPSRQAGSSEDDACVYRLPSPSQGEKKSRERESRHRLARRAPESWMPRTDEVDLSSSHLPESAAIGKGREDRTAETTQVKARSPHWQLSMGRSVRRDGTGTAAPGTKDREKSQGSSSSSSMGSHRRGKTVPSASKDIKDMNSDSHSKPRYLHRSRSMDRGRSDGTADPDSQGSSSTSMGSNRKTVPRASKDIKDMNSNSHSKPRYLHRSRSMDRGRSDKTADPDRTARPTDMEERPWQAHGRHNPGRTADRTAGTGRGKSRHPGLPDKGRRRSRREEDTAELGRFLFWSQVAAKSPQLKPRIIQSPQQIYGSAYQVEEETSSDSDDEVLQQYKRSMSQHSVRSKASVRSQRSKKGEKLASPAEKPEAEAAYQPIEEPDYHRPTRAPPADPYSRLEKGPEADEVMVESDLEPDHAYPDLEYDQEGLDNEAYDSEGANGAYGDQVSYHSQERRKRLKSRRHRPEGRSMSSQLNKGGLSSGEEDTVAAFPVSDAVSADEMSVASSAPDPNWKNKLEDRGYYDVDQPYDEDSQLISKCGVLEVAFAYDAPNRKMTVSIVQARDVPSKDRGGTGGYQVHMVLLPTKKQRCKTKVRQGNNPVFKESFRFSRVNQDELPDMGVRFRLYACERMKKERLIGEKLVGFSNLKLDQRESMAVTLPLEPRSNLSGGDSQFSLSGLSRSDSGSSSQSLTHAGGVPELLVGLAYNATTGRLSVEVIKGSHFRNMAMNRAPDTYVKICLMASNGQELSRSKTSIRRGQPNPVYKETFIFQVALFQLSDVTLMFSVYNKRGMKRKEMIGWFSLGLNNSGEEELNHWQDMRESKGQQVCRWHVLLES